MTTVAILTMGVSGSYTDRMGKTVDISISSVSSPRPCECSLLLIKHTHTLLIIPSTSMMTEIMEVLDYCIGVWTNGLFHRNLLAIYIYRHVVIIFNFIALYNGKN